MIYLLIPILLLSGCAYPKYICREKRIYENNPCPPPKTLKPGESGWVCEHPSRILDKYIECVPESIK